MDVDAWHVLCVYFSPSLKIDALRSNAINILMDMMIYACFFRDFEFYSTIFFSFFFRRFVGGGRGTEIFFGVLYLWELGKNYIFYSFLLFMDGCDLHEK